MSKHTPGPWQFAFEGGTVAFFVETDGTTIAKLCVTENSTAHSRFAANIDRIAACINACEGIETEVLKQHHLGVISAEASHKLHVYKDALHQVSLASQCSMSSQRECGQIARAAIAKAGGAA